MIFSQLSNHAIKRMKERTQLTEYQLTQILDNDLGVNTGTEFVFKRDHILIYSDIDDDFFVVIQDNITKVVVTILTIEYHQNLSWEIKNKKFNLAKFKGTHKRKPKDIVKLLIIKLYYYTYSTDYVKVLNVAKIAGDNTINIDTLHKLIESKCEEKNIHLNNIKEISLTKGKHGIPKFIDYSHNMV